MRSKKTIVFITIYPLNEDYAVKYGFLYWKERGYSIVIVNVFNYMFSRSVVEAVPHYQQLNKVSGIVQHKVNDKKDLEGMIQAIEGWRIAVLMMAPKIKILSTLKKFKTNYMLLGHMKMPEPKKSHFEKMYKILLQPNKVIQSVMYKAERLWVQYYFPPRYVTSLFWKNVACRKTTFILVNSFDYDRVIENRRLRKKNIPAGDYLLLLASHPWPVHDAHILGIRSAVTKTEYSVVINRFLKVVEESLGLKIVVAAYPKATDDENIYQGREFIRNNTEQLVKYSKGVIGHHTGAFNFAVLHNKPIAVISIRFLRKENNFYRKNEAYARELCVPVNYIDTEKDCRMALESGLFKEMNRYEQFKKKYLIAEKNRNKRIWHVVEDQFKEDERNGVIN